MLDLPLPQPNLAASMAYDIKPGFGNASNDKLAYTGKNISSLLFNFKYIL